MGNLSVAMEILLCDHPLIDLRKAKERKANAIALARNRDWRWI